MKTCRSPRATVGEYCPRFLLLVAALGLGCSGSSQSEVLVLQVGEELPGGDTTTLLAIGQNAFIRPADNLEREHRPLFFFGDSLFDGAWVQAPASTNGRDGLGPLFNARSCSSCHPRDGRGRPPFEGEDGFGGVLLRLSVPGMGEHGGPLAEANYGGQLQPYALSGVPAEASQSIEYSVVEGTYDDGESYQLLAPQYLIEDPQYGPLASGLLVSPRVGPAMIGLGLLEAISEENLLAQADPDDEDGDGISGKANRVWNVAEQALTLGRFGWKAGQPNLRQQSAGAFLGDLGVTSSLFSSQECSAVQQECRDQPGGGEPELPDDLLDAVQLYMRILAVPVRIDFSEPEVLQGKVVFQTMGCGECHTPSHRTAADAELVELQDQLIWPYTDLLLHDMGEALSDERPVYQAEGADWRTPPLWGIGRYESVNCHERLLHDGRARGVAEAVLWHGGEAEPAASAFRAASADERAALVRFVRSL